MRELKQSEAYDLFMLEVKRLSYYLDDPTKGEAVKYGHAITKLRTLISFAEVFDQDFEANTLSRI